MNLPNRITVGRILLIPIIMVLLLAPLDFPDIRDGDFVISWNQLIATMIFIVAAFTDGLDGYIARTRKMVTRLGKLLDPLADKLLVTTLLITLVEMDQLQAWIAIIIIAREFSVTGLRQVALLEGKVLAASIWGKWKTILQITMILALLLNNFPFHYMNFPFDVVVVWLTVVVTVISGVDYFYKNWNMIKEIRSEVS